MSWRDEKDLRSLTISNNGDSLILEIVAPIPTSRVDEFALKLLDPRDLRPFGHIQLSHGTDQEIGIDIILWVELCVFTSSGCANMNPPSLCLVIPSRILYCCVEANVLV